MRRSLSGSEVEILVGIVVRGAGDGSPLLTAVRQGTPTEDQEQELLDLVAVELAAHGFDAAYRPTPYGKQLETLIDVLSAV